MGSLNGTKYTKEFKNKTDAIRYREMMFEKLYKGGD